MIISRNKFLRATGISLLTAAGGKLAASLTGMTQSGAVPLSRELSAKRWAMVIDMSKCSEKEGCTKCIEASPRTQLTSFISACGGYWKCRPRTVPRLAVTV